MSQYQYVKSVRRVRIRPKAPLVVSLMLISLGVGLLFWIGWPIVAFTVFTQTLFATTVSPLADGGVVEKNSIAPAVLAADQTASPISSGFTNVNAWFPALPQKKVVTPVNTYLLSIPKLSIENANVVIGGDDLQKSLIHYGGTGLPGDYGNAVIFGHSTLPQFYNPKTYASIFSTLPTIKEGEDIFVSYDGVSYRYRVIRMTVLDPTDLSLLEQKFDDSYVTLVTCVPPGTYWKRLYVQAKLVRPTV